MGLSYETTKQNWQHSSTTFDAKDITSCLWKEIKLSSGLLPVTGLKNYDRARFGHLFPRETELSVVLFVSVFCFLPPCWYQFGFPCSPNVTWPSVLSSSAISMVYIKGVVEWRSGGLSPMLTIIKECLVGWDLFIDRISRLDSSYYAHLTKERNGKVCSQQWKKTTLCWF